MISAFNKALKVITSILTACLFILAMALVGVRIFGVQIYIVLSGSMEPVYQTGSVVYVKKVDPDELKVDDIITYKLDNVTVTHRIIGLVEDENDPSTVRFQTKGDANQYPDNGLVSKEDVIGSPVSTIPKLGFLADYIQQPPGIFFAAAVGVGVIILVLLSDMLDEKASAAEPPKKKKRKRRRRVKRIVKTKKENLLVENREQEGIKNEKEKLQKKKNPKQKI